MRLLLRRFNNRTATITIIDYRILWIFRIASSEIYCMCAPNVHLSCIDRKLQIHTQSNNMMPGNMVRKFNALDK